MSYSLGLRRTWFWLLGAGPLVLLLSILPSYVYLGHWTEYAKAAMGRPVEEESSGEVLDHAMHCHFNAASCSEQPAPINGHVLPAVGELTEPNLSDLAAIEQALSRLEDVLLAPATEPPRL